MNLSRTAAVRGGTSAAGRCGMLTDWVTTNGDGVNVLSIVQSPEGWMPVGHFAELVAYIEVAAVTVPTNGSVAIQLESGATPDESTFVIVAGPYALSPSTTPIVMKTASGGGTPLGPILRFRVLSTESGTAWGATFRIRVSGNRTKFFAPPFLTANPNLIAFWARPDQGVSLAGTTVSSWADQSGTGDPNKNLVAGNAAGSTSNPTMFPVDSLYNNQPTIHFSGAAGCYFKSTNWQNTVGGPALPVTWVVIGNRNVSNIANYAIDHDTNLATTGQSISGTAAALVQANAGANLTFANGWTTTPKAVLVEFNGGSSTIYFNNFTTASMTGNAGVQLQDSLAVGAQNPAAAGGAQNLWTGVIAEVMGFSGLLTSTQKGILRTYLNNRYALSIT